MLETLLISSLFVAGFWSCRLLAKRSGDPFLVATVALGYVVRSGLAVALYGISRWQLPLGRSVQLGEGFWNFAPDAVFYHRYATTVSVAHRAGLALPPASINGDPGYPLVVAATYAVLGTHPLFAIWLNVVLASFTVILAYMLAQTLGGRQAGRSAAALVAFWPSSLVWATQLLKDAIETFLIVAFVWMFYRASTPDAPGARRPRALNVAFGVTASIVLVAALRLRVYVGLALLVSATLVLSIMAAAAIWRRQYRRAVASGALVALLVGATWMSTWLPAEPFRTFDSQVELDRLSAELASNGDTVNAGWLHLAFPVGLIKERAVRDARVAREDDQRIPAIFRLLSASFLAEVRHSFLVRSSSPAQADSAAAVNEFADLIRFVPRALVSTFFSPSPWTSSVGDSSLPSAFRWIAMIETLFVILLLYFAVRGMLAAVPSAWPLTLLIATFSLVMAVALGFAIPQVGALFRMRLAIIVPLCIPAGVGLTRHRMDAGR